ncbi:stage II sporulation protein R [Bacillus swezeyi]|uniref:Stage II sporulation protein R n=1 Tax=Bacillus swezeyi TaxID=1925020 RepID=A0A1R1S289_9BACI|nr:stage II sporulation protein R [Bacillus swezeyi]MEC1259260.1 stage II sporulation protein R [Bacillus swezeyi]MED1740585.1 stage II sporulation protein R [Bacillus swezeyi]MED2927778.1 stage II sporulation protein R [Bacillus swezeyi]MED2965309.1 stage II sporulation protein R [Bacillus swezeyi]MED2977585.1 stage II sporulation protein R [Bacillus swezeyi]
MKKSFMACVYIFLLLIGAIANLATEETAQSSGGEPAVIPDEAIRLRILANSDSESDQNLKRKIRDEVNQEITKWVEDLTSMKEARQVIRSKLPEIKKIAKDAMKRENASQSVDVNFDKVSFPTKLYGNMVYPAGEYEAVLITLGEGEGANWWCVLFPPLCFLDFSNGEAVKSPDEDQAEEEKTTETDALALSGEEKEEDKEVKFFLVEWFTGLFS